MATLEQIRDRQERPATAEEILAWHRKVTSSTAWDVRIPDALGPVAYVEAVCDEAFLPFYVLDKSSRYASIATTYRALYNNEMRR